MIVGIHPLLCNDVLATNITVESGQFDDDAEYQGHNVDGGLEATFSIFACMSSACECGLHADRSNSPCLESRI